MPPPRVAQAPVTCGQASAATDVEHVGAEGQLGPEQSSRLGTSPSWILGTAVTRHLKECSSSETGTAGAESPGEQDALLGRSAGHGVAEGQV